MRKLLLLIFITSVARATDSTPADLSPREIKRCFQNAKFVRYGLMCQNARISARYKSQSCLSNYEKVFAGEKRRPQIGDFEIDREVSIKLDKMGQLRTLPKLLFYTAASWALWGTGVGLTMKGVQLGSRALTATGVGIDLGSYSIPLIGGSKVLKEMKEHKKCLQTEDFTRFSSKDYLRCAKMASPNLIFEDTVKDLLKGGPHIKQEYESLSWNSELPAPVYRAACQFMANAAKHLENTFSKVQCVAPGKFRVGDQVYSQRISPSAWSVQNMNGQERHKLNQKMDYPLIMRVAAGKIAKCGNAGTTQQRGSMQQMSDSGTK